MTVGQWVRLYQPAASSTNGRRRLQGAAALAGAQGIGPSSPAASLGRKLRQDVGVAPLGKVSVLGVGPPEGGPAPAPAATPAPGPSPAGGSGKAYALEARPPVQGWYEDPEMQAALEAAVEAQWVLAAEVAANPDKVQWLQCGGGRGELLGLLAGAVLLLEGYCRADTWSPTLRISSSPPPPPATTIKEVPANALDPSAIPLCLPLTGPIDFPPTPQAGACQRAGPQRHQPAGPGPNVPGGRLLRLPCQGERGGGGLRA